MFLCCCIHGLRLQIYCLLLTLTSSHWTSLSPHYTRLCSPLWRRLSHHKIWTEVQVKVNYLDKSWIIPFKYFLFQTHHHRSAVEVYPKSAGLISEILSVLFLSLSLLYTSLPPVTLQELSVEMKWVLVTSSVGDRKLDYILNNMNIVFQSLDYKIFLEFIFLQNKK